MKEGILAMGIAFAFNCSIMISNIFLLHIQSLWEWKFFILMRWRLQ